MKKIKFLSAVALTLALGACDNFDLPNPEGQTNPDLPVFENSGIELQSLPADNLIDLKAANQANEFVTVSTIQTLVNFPSDDYELVVDMQVGPADHYTTIETVITEEGAVTVNPDFLNGAIQEIYSKEPGKYVVPVRFAAYAVRETTRVRLGSLTTTYCEETLNVVTLDPVKVMEQSYYVVPINPTTGNPLWAQALVMNNTSGEGVSVYDNPEFAVKFNITEAQATAGYKWKLFPASVVEGGKNPAEGFGCTPKEGDTLSGKLSLTADPGVITLIGDVQVVVNVEQDSYTVSYALENLYPLSGSTLTKPENALLLYTGNYINYSGVSVLNTSYHLAGQPDYKGAVVFKQSKEEEPVDSEDGLTRTGLLTAASDGTQLKTPVKGAKLYFMDVNLVQLTYSITAIESLCVMGAGNDWSFDTAVTFAPKDAKNPTVWTATGVHLKDEFKIAVNGAWAISFGGNLLSDFGSSVQYSVTKSDGGGNMPVVKEGTYDVEIDFTAYPYTVTVK